jgi:capsular exopolysaccharide synthesis family protein
MEFFTKEVECPLIVISSSIPGEGKTFVAINLASVYSLMGAKTLLVGYDLRRPTLSNNFEMPEAHGATDVLIGRKKLDEVIQPSGYENLDILPSGSIPPNPAELAGSVKAKEVFAELKKKYDCVIVDSPPVGVVSDIIPVATMADAMLMVVRHHHTKKNALSATLSDLGDYQIKGIGMLINDVKLTGSGSYKYNYKYKYDYKPVNTGKGKNGGPRKLFKKKEKVIEKEKENVVEAEKSSSDQ